MYAVEGNGWRDQLSNRAAHTPALQQVPDTDYWPHRTLAVTGPTVARPNAGDLGRQPDRAQSADRGDQLPPLRLVPPPPEPPEPGEGLDLEAEQRGGRPADAQGAAPAPQADWLVPLTDAPPAHDYGPEDLAPARSAAMATSPQRDLPSIAT